MKTYFIEGIRDSKNDSDSDANQSAESPENESPQNGASSKPLLAQQSGGTPEHATTEEESKPPPEDATEKNKDAASVNLEVNNVCYVKIITIVCFFPFSYFCF